MKTPTTPSIFISGASKGIGLALAHKYYEAGYRVGICARGSAALDSAKKAMPNLITFVCDVSQKTAVKALAVEVGEQLGPLEVLINNAGFYLPGSVHEEADEVYEQMMRTNMDSAYYLTKGLVGAMKNQQRGAIVNISSIAALGAYPNGGSYGISKFAMLGFSKNLRLELRPHGIRVISVMPGAVLTDSWSSYTGPENRLMSPEDIADIIFLATNLSRRTVVEEIVLRPQLGDL